MGSPFFQPVDPAMAPDPVTPQVPSADASGWAMVTPHSTTPAGYGIQAPMMDGEIGTAFDGANAVAGSGVLYPMGPRQAETRVLLESPQGFSAGSGTSGYDILAGFSGEGTGAYGWPNDMQPAALLETPDQGQMGTYPQSNTGTD